jgi:hypothetical protein
MSFALYLQHTHIVGRLASDRVCSGERGAAHLLQLIFLRGGRVPKSKLAPKVEDFVKQLSDLVVGRIEWIEGDEGASLLQHFVSASTLVRLEVSLCQQGLHLTLVCGHLTLVCDRLTLACDLVAIVRVNRQCVHLGLQLGLRGHPGVPLAAAGRTMWCRSWSLRHG